MGRAPMGCPLLLSERYEVAVGAKNLVVVESPTKARTLERMLGPDYKVEASFGHIRDLPKSKMGVNLKTFVPEYIVPDDSEKHARTLRREAKAAEHVWLATDLDREGEAIAWHLADIIKVPKSKLRRVTFHEITPAAIDEAFKHPRDIDQDLVNAQQARRVVDRLVGYTMSPLLWKKIRYGLSAGRVQSVALRLIVDREREIQAFKPQEYWTLEAALANHAGETFGAEVIQQKGHKLEIHDGEAADKHRAALAEASYAVKSVEKRESGRNAAPPFTTSTIQQEASRKLGYSVKRTMVLAQQLYEGIAVGDGAPVGLITYMRTDSLHVAESALHQAREVITKEFGTPYEPEKEIAPLPEVQPGEALKLLGLEASQHFTQPPPRFTEASLVKTLEEFGIGRPSTYAPTISTLVDRKYVRKDGRALFPEDVGFVVTDFLREHFPEIVDTGFTVRMEEDLDRIAAGEVEWVPVVRDFFEPFAKLVEEKSKSVKKSDVTEEATDRICPKCGRPVVIKLGRYGRFYSCTGFKKGKKGDPLPPGACDYSEPLEGQKEPPLELLEREMCPECGKQLSRRRGRFGPFVGCTGYPDCKYIKKTQQKTGVICPDCAKGELVRRRGRGRSMFYGCERYPDCTFTARELSGAAATPGKDAA